MPPWVEHRWSCVSALIGRVRWPCMAPNTLLAANTQMHVMERAGGHSALLSTRTLLHTNAQSKQHFL